MEGSHICEHCPACRIKLKHSKEKSGSEDVFSGEWPLKVL